MAFIFGKPSLILLEFQVLIKSGELFNHVGATVTAATIGFILGTTLGIVLGLVLSLSQSIFRFSEPYILFLGALPVFALGPIIVFWFGTGLTSKVILVIIATFSLSVMQAYTGAKNADESLVDMLRVYGANNRQIMWHVRAPNSIVWVLSALKLNVGIALIGTVIGEFIASRVGLGHLIIRGEGLYNMNLIWVGVISITCIALMANWLLSKLEQMLPAHFYR